MRCLSFCGEGFEGGSELNHWIEVSGARLAGNFEVLRRAVGPETALLAVIKANAYGHGVVVCAATLARAGAEWLGVTDAEDGVAVRAALVREGIATEKQPEILLMSGMCEDEASAVVQRELTPVVWSSEQLAWVSAAAEKVGRRVRVHVEVDTGMSRQGARAGAELDGVLERIAASKWLRLGGIFTHFAAAEVAGSAMTVEQRQRFELEWEHRFVNDMVIPEWVHAGNSSTVDEGAGLKWVRGLAASISARAMVRPGLALYGYCLGLEGGASRVRGEVKPVMTWKTKVIGLREIEAGTRVGYNGAFTAKKKMRLALLPVGYADGLRREMSGTDERTGGWVMIGGKRAAIVGRVSMNLTTVDVSGFQEAGINVRLGDEVVVLGDGISAEEHARIAETIPYEILCGVRGKVVLV